MLPSLEVSQQSVTNHNHYDHLVNRVGGSGEPKFPLNAHCEHFQATMELVGRRWTASILRSLFAGCNRFTEIARTIPGISHRLLAERLDELEGAGLVVASGDARPCYSLTEKGGDLRHALSEIDAWNQKWVDANAGTARS